MKNKPLTVKYELVEIEDAEDRLLKAFEILLQNNSPNNNEYEIIREKV